MTKLLTGGAVAQPLISMAIKIKKMRYNPAILNLFILTPRIFREVENIKNCYFQSSSDALVLPDREIYKPITIPTTNGRIGIIPWIGYIHNPKII